MKIEIIQGDITEQQTDAIVNAANTSLLGGGGVDGAIHKKAGPKLLEECRKLGGCNTGEAKITKAYNLPATYVIHTPGPIWQQGRHDEEKLLASCYKNSLILASQYKIKTVAFPSISTGVYRFPVEKAAAIALKTVWTFLQKDKSIEKVTFVLFDANTKQAYLDALQVLQTS